MSKKRIAIFGANFWPSKGGTSRIVENVLWELHDDFEFTVYCFKHPAAASHIPGVKTVEFPEIPIKGFGVFLFFFQCFLHLMLKGKFDLIHVHKIDGAVFLPFLTRKFKVIATSHMSPYQDDKWSALGKIYFRVCEYFFVHSKSVLSAVSKVLVEFYREKYKRQAVYLPNGIFPVKEVRPELADDLLSKFKISPGYLLFAARRIVPNKGGHTLIEALKLIKYQGTLVVAGDDDQFPSYTAQLKSASEGLDVKFIGYVEGMDKINALIKQANLFIFPSEIEAMSMMMLEAASVGTPMICSDIPQNTAVLSDEDVMFFQNKNARDLADKMQWAFAHPAEMKALALLTKEKVERDYVISSVAQNYKNLYNEVIQAA